MSVIKGVREQGGERTVVVELHPLLVSELVWILDDEMERSGCDAADQILLAAVGGGHQDIPFRKQLRLFVEIRGMGVVGRKRGGEVAGKGLNWVYFVSPR